VLLVLPVLCVCSAREFGKRVGMGLSFSDTDLHGFMVAMGDWLIHSRAAVMIVRVVAGGGVLKCTSPSRVELGGARHGRRAGHTFVFVEHGTKFLIVEKKSKSYENSC
jgi:hypothetical protein